MSSTNPVASNRIPARTPVQPSSQLVMFVLPLAMLALPALAGTPINETRPLDARGHVEISNLKGRIEVRSWDKQEVRITGTLGKGVEALQIDGSSADLEIKVKYPRNTDDRKSEPTDLIIDAPTLASLEIDGVATDIKVEGNAGKTLDIDSVSGDITVAAAPGQADIESVSGNQVLTLNSSNVDAQSVSGDIALAGRLGGEISIETVSGDIMVNSKGERVKRLESNSVSGDAELRVGIADGARFSAESVSGDIALITAKSLSARVSGESFSGDLVAPGASINRSKYGPGSDFEHTYGNGSADVRMETFSGDAELQFE